jgi:palmitoyltransferase ZDHHC13/17
MDSTAIAMKERVRIEDNVASAILNSASGSGLDEFGGDVAQDALSDAEVRFRVSALAIHPYSSRTPSCVRWTT